MEGSSIFQMMFTKADYIAYLRNLPLLLPIFLQFPMQRIKSEAILLPNLQEAWVSPVFTQHIFIEHGHHVSTVLGHERHVMKMTDLTSSEFIIKGGMFS
jgi:hypothetical protein